MLKTSKLHAAVAEKPILYGLDVAVRGFAVEAQKLLGISLEGSVG